MKIIGFIFKILQMTKKSEEKIWKRINVRYLVLNFKDSFFYIYKKRET